MMEERNDRANGKTLSIIGVPTSAGAYGPGQEQAPSALRASGLIRLLEEKRVICEDLGDIAGYRWRVDKASPKAMSIDKVIRVSKSLAKTVRSALDEETKILVLGGDCTVELGAFAGATENGKSVGLIYIDLDTDLNTPETTGEDAGALDWMGVAHLLNIDGVIPELSGFAGRVPLSEPNQIMFFANKNSLPFERDVIKKMGIGEVSFDEVIKDPEKAAKSVIDGWAGKFDRLLIHLDMDVLNSLDLPLAENCRKQGLFFEQLLSALSVFVKSPNWSVLTITELNPYHGEEDGSTLRKFVDELTGVLSKAFNEDVS